jgi:hypothetical protein
MLVLASICPLHRSSFYRESGSRVYRFSPCFLSSVVRLELPGKPRRPLLRALPIAHQFSPEDWAIGPASALGQRPVAAKCSFAQVIIFSSLSFRRAKWLRLPRF